MNGRPASRVPPRGRPASRVPRPAIPFAHRCVAPQVELALRASCARGGQSCSRDAERGTRDARKAGRGARAGYSLLEMVFALAIFTLLLMVVVSLENQMLRFDRAMRIRFMVHPEEMAVIARVRKDVLDAQGYPQTAGPYTQSPTALILNVLDEDDVFNQVVYDFTQEGLVKRLTYEQNMKKGEWVARGVPKYEVDSFQLPDERVAVRLRGYDTKGKLIVDQVLVPRRKN